MNFKFNAAKALLGAAVVAGAVTAISKPASAIGLFTTGGPNSPLSNVIEVDFSDGTGTLPGTYNENGIEFSGGGGIRTGSLANQYAAPPGNGTTNPYLTLGGTNEPSPVSIALGGLRGYFGLFWGSVDSYNTIEFFNGTTSLGIFNGGQVLDPANGNQGQGGARYANFFANNNDFFDRVVLRSSSPAFELDNVAVRNDIPTPALLPGLIGMGVAALRKKRKEAAEQADA